MTLAAELQTIRERVSNLEAMRVELLPYKVELTPAEEDRARLLDAVEKVIAELDHASANGHHLDRDCQGVGPGELVPAVRIENIEAAINTALEGK